jgi:hypothetical protein
MNAWLLDRCVAYAKAHPHPELRAETVWAVFERERLSLVPYQSPFDGFHAVAASVSKTCLVRCDGNRYSVMAKAVGRPAEVHAYADRIVIRQDGEIVGEHPRRFGRDQTIYDPWHYVPVLARKPGAWRNGAPFKDWVLPGALERVRRRLTQADDGGRQMVEILSAVTRCATPMAPRYAAGRLQTPASGGQHCMPIGGQSWAPVDTRCMVCDAQRLLIPIRAATRTAVTARSGGHAPLDERNERARLGAGEPSRRVDGGQASRWQGPIRQHLHNLSGI